MNTYEITVRRLEEFYHTFSLIAENEDKARQQAESCIDAGIEYSENYESECLGEEIFEITEVSQ